MPIRFFRSLFQSQAHQDGAMPAPPGKRPQFLEPKPIRKKNPKDSWFHFLAARETSPVLSDADEAQVGDLWFGNSAAEAAYPQERKGVAPSTGERRQ